MVTATSSIHEWFSMAENVLEYANESGEYNEIKEFLEFNKPKKRKIIGFM